ncbi:MAG: cytochrome c oxidase subunit 3 [Thermoleophilia bacterium]
MASIAHGEVKPGKRPADLHAPPIHYSSRVHPPLLGMYLFLGSEAMLFGSFFAAYFFARVAVDHPEGWPPFRPGTEEQFHLPVYLALINTIILVTSSFTAHWATTAIKKDQRSGVIGGLLLTFFLGLAFLLVQAREYSHIGFSPRDEAFGSTFYALTGLHGVHVLMGLSLLLMTLVRAIRGHYSAKNHLGLELPIIYWHFVDVMWIIVYVTVYVL